MSVHAPRSERIEHGRARRQILPRSAHADCPVVDDARDPVAILQAQDLARLPDLVPIRYGRMLATPFTFLRGAAAVMAHDLAATPHSGITVQLCGDAHLSNFGAFAAPDRRLVFDVNDFDETLPGPFEWDLKRLAASLVVAARADAFPVEVARAATLGALAEYRERIAAFADMATLDVWYDRVEVEHLLELARSADAGIAKRAERTLAKARHRTSMQVFEKLTEVVDGKRRIVSDPPLVVPLHERGIAEEGPRVRAFYGTYRESLADDRRRLLDRFTIVDMAHKVVGVGSVGTRCVIVLLQDGDGAPLFLQFKEAGRSVLEAHLPASRYRNHGRRVVEGQRLVQAASDIFLGWARDVETGIDFYFRQLRDMKVSADVARMNKEGFAQYARLCAGTLARAHARSGDAAEIAGYLGSNDRFDRAVAAWAESYADQTERDHARLEAAVADGRVEAHPGL